MKNKLSDLNNHLFAQLERLSDEELSEEQLQTEIARTKAITTISAQIIANGNLVLDANKFKAESLGMDCKVPSMLEEGNE